VLASPVPYGRAWPPIIGIIKLGLSAPTPYQTTKEFLLFIRSTLLPLHSTLVGGRTGRPVIKLLMRQEGDEPFGLITVPFGGGQQMDHERRAVRCGAVDRDPAARFFYAVGLLGFVRPFLFRVSLLLHPPAWTSWRIVLNACFILYRFSVRRLLR